jgi:hypothetical protein
MEEHPVRLVFAAILLVAVTVAIHATGMLVLLRLLVKRRATGEFHYFRGILAMAFIVIALLSIHVTELLVWAIYYNAKGYLPDFVTSVYFSMTTYSTLGYGDIVLKGSARLLSGVESLAGLLMIGWSTALLLRAVGWVNARLMNHWGLKPD